MPVMVKVKRVKPKRCLAVYNSKVLVFNGTDADLYQQVLSLGGKIGDRLKANYEDQTSHKLVAVKLTSKGIARV